MDCRYFGASIEEREDNREEDHSGVKERKRKEFVKLVIP